MSRIYFFCCALPTMILIPLWVLLWAPLANMGFTDDKAIIDAQRYFYGYSTNKFDVSLPITHYCYSWNDCLHNYIYSFSHTYFKSGLPVNLFIYFCISCFVLRLISFYASSFRLSTNTTYSKLAIILSVFYNPFLLVYSSVPSKELLSTFFIVLSIMYLQYLRRVLGVKTKNLAPKRINFIYLLLALILGLILFYVIFSYRFQLLPVSIVIGLVFAFRARIALFSFKIRINFSRLLLIALLFVSCVLFLLNSNFIEINLFNKSNLVYLLAPFNFPFFINPSIFNAFFSRDATLLFWFSFATQLNGFIVTVFFIANLNRKCLSSASFILLILSSLVGYLYGDQSARYTTLISYFSLVSMVIDFLCLAVGLQFLAHQNDSADYAQ